ncbi:unnamed protein product, partial [Rotaria sp. Silwood1]
YEKELIPTCWSSIRQGFIYGVYTGWLILQVYLTYSIGFISGSLLMPEKCHPFSNISDILIVVCSVARCFNFYASTGLCFQSLSAARGAAASVFRLIEEENDTTINETSVWDNKESIDNINGDIEFDNVNFVYPSRKDVPALCSLSLMARVGKTTALVGASGCGKSTCISLLIRYYEPSSGRIMIGGRPITGFNVNQLRQSIGVASQEPVLFDMSIYENIRFGKVNATQKEIEQAAQDANAHDFIMQLPNKYQTIVGERGIQLSGGEKQRIALARALVRQPTILLLDEATSALDNISEKLVQEALDRVCKGRTTIIIAHRLSTIQNAHQIYVLDNGTVIEQGTHETLMKKEGGKYQVMFNRQQMETINDDKSGIMSMVFGFAIFSLQALKLIGIMRLAASVSAAETFFDLFDRNPIIDNGSTKGQELLIDDIDIRQLNLQWIRSQFGLVSQEPILFDLTIAENIAYGLDNVSMEDIINAARRANIHQFIDQLPQGYETKVGLKGSFLSGGEKQRIAIARVLVRRPKVLLLDEPTSAMDSYNEHIVQEALDQAQIEDSSRTSLIVAHRLSTIRSCDLICALHRGHIVESGTHAELAQRRGAYCKMLAQNNLQ